MFVGRAVPDVVVLKDQRVGFGASGRNGGYSLDCADLLPELGPERAHALYRFTTDAVEPVRLRIVCYGIECDATCA
jgi:gamma-glutamylputrescine oxidase